MKKWTQNAPEICLRPTLSLPLMERSEAEIHSGPGADSARMLK